MISIHNRLLIAASVTLLAFMGMTGLALDRAYRESAAEAIYQRLQAHIYGLIATAEINLEGTLAMPNALAETRFNQPGSGLYAQIDANNTQTTLWRSASTLGQPLRSVSQITAGEFKFYNPYLNNADNYFDLSFGLVWEVESNEGNIQEQQYSFTVYESTAAYEQQLQRFRNTLWLWLAGASVLLVLVQFVILRWSLSPLRQVGDDLRAVESGNQDQLAGDYPREIDRLTTNINQLLASQRRQLERYRHSLADLAHSLKTPLTILRGHSELNKIDSATIQSQTDRMKQIINYQLHRASTAGHHRLIRPLNLRIQTERITQSLAKVYADKQIEFDINIDPQLEHPMDGGDYMESIGNLLDNAGKWCQSKVKISVTNNDHLKLLIEDDGPGIDEALAEEVLQRGVRADTLKEGQGIGLAVAHDIIQSYQGSLAIHRAELGGVAIEVQLPLASAT